MLDELAVLHEEEDASAFEDTNPGLEGPHKDY